MGAENIMQQTQMQVSLAKQKMMLGNILLHKNQITMRQLNEALLIQSEIAKPLGKLLLETGRITKAQLELALWEQHWRQSGYWVID